MVTRTEVLLIDDIDAAQSVETLAAETIRIGFGSDHYEIDLSKENASDLRALMRPYIAAARRVPSPRRETVRTAAHRRSRAAARSWARQNGFSWVTDKGRIPAEAITAWEEAGRPGTA